jgi:hypothetical protein
MKLPKTPDEQIADFNKIAEFKDKESWVEGYRKRHPNNKKEIHWYQIPVYFALIVGLSSIMALPFLLVLALLKYLGVI